MLIVPLTVVLLVVGWLFLVAGRQCGPVASSAGRVGRPDVRLPGRRLASAMTDGLDRTARAVDVLVERGPGEDPLAARPRDPEQRQTTYVVVGGGLLGLAVLLAAGLVLVVSA